MVPFQTGFNVKGNGCVCFRTTEGSLPWSNRRHGTAMLTFQSRLDQNHQGLFAVVSRAGLCRQSWPSSHEGASCRGPSLSHASGRDATGPWGDGYVCSESECCFPFTSNIPGLLVSFRRPPFLEDWIYVVPRSSFLPCPPVLGPRPRSSSVGFMVGPFTLTERVSLVTTHKITRLQDTSGFAIPSNTTVNVHVRLVDVSA